MNFASPFSKTKIEYCYYWIYRVTQMLWCHLPRKNKENIKIVKSTLTHFQNQSNDYSKEIDHVFSEKRFELGIAIVLMHLRNEQKITY